MADLLKPLGLAALIAFAGPALGQDSGTGDGSATPAPATEAPATGDGAAPAPAEGAAPAAPDGQAQAGGTTVDMGTPATPAAQPKIETYVAETYGAWSRECIKLPEGQDRPDPCQISQILHEGDNKNAIGKMTVGKLPEGGKAAAGSMIIVPLGTLLTQQITLGVDQGAARRYPFRFCDRVGCVAQIGLTAAEVQSLKAGKMAKITIRPAAKPDQQVVVDVSLDGFTKAWESLATPPAPTPGQ